MAKPAIARSNPPAHSSPAEEYAPDKSAPDKKLSVNGPSAKPAAAHAAHAAHTAHTAHTAHAAHAAHTAHTALPEDYAPEKSAPDKTLSVDGLNQEPAKKPKAATTLGLAGFNRNRG